MSAYPERILELHQSEVFGEGAMLALWKAAKNEREKYHFFCFLQMETETKARLRPLLIKYGFDLEEGTDPDQIQGLVAGYQAAEYTDFLTGMKPMIEDFMQRFKEIAAIGPEEDQEILQSMIPHEEAFIHWIDKELAGEEGSMDAVLDISQYPIPKP